MDNSLPPVPLAEDLSPENIDAPVLLYNFLVWSLGGRPDSDINISSNQRASATDLFHRHAMSLMQDMIHCTTNGCIRTCRHLALPLTVRHLTHSEQVVTLLNRFGHGCSSSKLPEYETSLAEQLVRQSKNGESHRPSNIVSNTSVIFCWDNNHLIVKKTLSGKGRTHCTNGIVVQRRVCKQPVVKPCPARKKQSKLWSLEMPVYLP